MRMSLRELETSVRATPACARWQEFAPLSDTRHNLQFGNGRCSGHAKPQFNYCTRANWLAGGAVTRNAVQIDLGGPQFNALGPSIGIRLLYRNHSNEASRSISPKFQRTRKTSRTSIFRCDTWEMNCRAEYRRYWWKMTSEEKFRRNRLC